MACHRNHAGTVGPGPIAPSLAAVADRIEASADSLAAYMESMPLDSPQRRDLSLRAGERYEVDPRNVIVVKTGVSND